MSIDANYHFNRCKGSVGTTIDGDLQSMENYLKQCRGTSSSKPIVVPKPPTVRKSEDVWDLIVINKANNARSNQSYRIPSVTGRFTAQNIVSGNLALGGEVRGSSFKAIGTDNTGYQAYFIGKAVGTDRFQGEGYDNRGRKFTFELVRRR